MTFFDILKIGSFRVGKNKSFPNLLDEFENAVELIDIKKSIEKLNKFDEINIIERQYFPEDGNDVNYLEFKIKNFKCKINEKDFINVKNVHILYDGLVFFLYFKYNLSSDIAVTDIAYLIRKFFTDLLENKCKFYLRKIYPYFIRETFVLSNKDIKINKNLFLIRYTGKLDKFKHSQYEFTTFELFDFYCSAEINGDLRNLEEEIRNKYKNSNDELKNISSLNFLKRRDSLIKIKSNLCDIHNYIIDYEIIYRWNKNILDKSSDIPIFKDNKYLGNFPDENMTKYLEYSPFNFESYVNSMNHIESLLLQSLGNISSLKITLIGGVIGLLSGYILGIIFN